MRANRFQDEHKPIPLSADGEIAEGKFCAYCGALNPDDIPYCQHCGEYIVDQGPDLAARLARISRRASGIPSTAGGLIGSDHERKVGVIKRLAGSRFVWMFHVIGLSLEILFIVLLSRLVVLLISGH